MDGIKVADAPEVLRRLSVDELRAIVGSIYDAMNGREWDSDTLEYISSILDQAGLELREPE